MNYRLVNLGRDYPGKIHDFAAARNSFLTGLRDEEYVLFVEEDEEIPKMLLDYIGRLKPEYPYYNIRRFSLVNNRYIPLFNPSFQGKLVSNKVRYERRIHEVVRPFKPCGWIDIPVIHNQIDEPSSSPYPVPTPGWYKTRLYRLLLVLFKLREIMRGW